MRTANTRIRWPDADAQADLSLRWTHMPFCWFCHVAAHLVLRAFKAIFLSIFTKYKAPCYYKNLFYFNHFNSSMDDDDEQLSAKMAAVMFHTLVALVKAGPCSTQTELMEKIRTHRSPDITEYAQVRLPK